MSISRTGLLATWLFLVLIIFYKYLYKFMHTLFIKMCAFMGIISVYGLYVYFTYDFATTWTLNAQLFDWKVTTGRIQQAVAYLSNNPIRLFSNRFPDNGTLFELGAFRLFYECGYLWGGIFFFAFFCLIIISLRKHWDFVIPLSVYFIFCSLYEFDPVTRPTYNVIVFFLPLLIYSTTADKFHNFILSCQKTRSLKS